MTFRTKFLLFVSIRVPPNNPITACGVTSFPGYYSFPKWANDAAFVQYEWSEWPFVFSSVYGNIPEATRMVTVIRTTKPISFPEHSLPLSSETVSLDKGNEGSGKEIAIKRR